MTKEEFTELIRKHIQSLGEMTEEEEAQSIAAIEKNSPHPHVMDLIYWPPDNKDLSAEEIADIAFAYDWKANQKVLCNAQMEELLQGSSYVLSDDDNLVLKYFDAKDRLDLRTRWDIPQGVHMSEIAKHNTITLDEYGSFGEMLNVVVNFERYLKTVYPNGYFQSYFILKKNQKPFLTFHHESPNCDWIRNEEILKLSYPIRKNTF